MRRVARWTFGAGGCTAAVVALSLVGSGTAIAKGIIPKHFAYAAEVRVSVEYDATFTRQASNDDPCGDANGNTLHQPIDANEQEVLDRTILFKHITVPVVPESALGKAAAKLALPAIITDPGRVTSEHSTYVLSGDTLSQDTCPGTKAQYHCAGTIYNPTGIYSVLSSSADGFHATDFAIPVFSDQFAKPATCGAISADDIPTLLGIDASQAHDGWAEVQLHSIMNPRFYYLRNHTQVAWTVPVEGAKSCGGNGQLSCMQSVTGHATITIKRLLLHYTHNSYKK